MRWRGTCERPSLPFLKLGNTFGYWQLNREDVSGGYQIHNNSKPKTIHRGMKKICSTEFTNLTTHFREPWIPSKTQQKLFVPAQSLWDFFYLAVSLSFPALSPDQPVLWGKLATITEDWEIGAWVSKEPTLICSKKKKKIKVKTKLFVWGHEVHPGWLAFRWSWQTSNLALPVRQLSKSEKRQGGSHKIFTTLKTQVRAMVDQTIPSWAQSIAAAFCNGGWRNDKNQITIQHSIPCSFKIPL